MLQFAYCLTFFIFIHVFVGMYLYCQLLRFDVEMLAAITKWTSRFGLQNCDTLWATMVLATLKSSAIMTLNSFYFSGGGGSFIYVESCIKIFLSMKLFYWLLVVSRIFFQTSYDNIILVANFQGKLAFTKLSCEFIIHLLIHPWLIGSRWDSAGIIRGQWGHSYYYYHFTFCWLLQNYYNIMQSQLTSTVNKFQKSKQIPK